jgi:subtilisin family serine protease
LTWKLEKHCGFYTFQYIRPYPFRIHLNQTAMNPSHQLPPFSMKGLLLAFAFIFLFFVLPGFSTLEKGLDGTSVTLQDDIAPGMVIVKFKNPITLQNGSLSTGIPSIDQLIVQTGISEIEQCFPNLVNSPLRMASEMIRIYYFRFDTGADPEEVADVFTRDPNIEYAEPKSIPKLDVTPDDPSFSSMNYFSRIQADQAWNLVKGETGNVLIAVVDDGADLDHEDLAANLWVNPGEIPGNGIDDDMNGYGDDVSGWNFWDNNGDANPGGTNSHGTHTSGTAAGVTDNATGVASISWNVKFLPVNCGEPSSTSIPFGYEGIVYAASMGADIISCSWGGGSGSQFGQEAVNFAMSNGSLVIAAAGNDGMDLDFTPHYPSSYPGVLSVGASSSNSEVKAGFSNYGYSIDLFAPGVNILSTTPNNTYTAFQGTSMATPLVAGVAALVKTLHPTWTAEQVREQVRVTAEDIDWANPGFEMKMGKGRVNAFLAAANTTLPSVRIREYSFTDSGGDGDVNSGDTINLQIEFINYLTAVSGLGVSLSTPDTNIQVIQGTGSISALATFQTELLDFQFVVKDTAPEGLRIPLVTDLSAGVYSDRDVIFLELNPRKVFIFDNGDLRTAITVDGNFGWLDFEGSMGAGFEIDGENWLYEGGLMLGTGAHNVSDCIRGDDPMVQDHDFLATSALVEGTPVGPANVAAFVDLDDSQAADPAGIYVSWEADFDITAFPGISKGIALIYTFRNTTSDTFDYMHTGLFMDWNLNANSQDFVGIDSTRKLIYVMDNPTSPTKIAAIKLLSNQVPFGLRGIDNSVDLDDGFSNSEKWDFMTGGIQNGSLGPADVSTMLTAGPIRLGPNKIITLGYWVYGASSITEMNSIADGTQLVWDMAGVPTGIESPLVSENPFTLSAYPNPFEGTSTISWKSELASVASLEILDMQGRLLRRFSKEISSGLQTLVWDGMDENGNRVAAGIYLARLSAGPQTQAIRLIKMGD